MTLPKLNLEAAQAGYGAGDGDAILRSDVGVGMPRTRRDFIGAAGNASANLELDEAEFDYWRAFYNSVIGEGALPFAMDLVFDNSTLDTYEVKLAGPPRFGVKGLLQTVQINLYVKKPVRDTAADIALVTIFGDYGGGAGDVLAALSLLANDSFIGLDG